jgi:hypothetical protein
VPNCSPRGPMHTWLKFARTAVANGAVAATATGNTS